MTQIDIECRCRPGAGAERIKKADLKIDMTPMVDLGFLLMSFFIFTTEISKPTVTNLNMPHDGSPTPIPASKSLTILLGNDDHVFYYSGDMNEAIKNKEIIQTSYNELSGIGHIIRQKQNQLSKRNADIKELIVLIKPSTNSSYKNMVDALDEMLINQVTRYVIADPQTEESAFLDGPNHDH